MTNIASPLEPGTRIRVQGCDIHDRLIAMDWMPGRVVQSHPGIVIVKLDDLDWPRTVRPGSGAAIEVIDQDPP